MAVLAREGAVEGLWLRADRQTAGRGRLGRAWVSPPGNLHASTLVRLREGDPQAATLAVVAAVALEEVVRGFLLQGGVTDSGGLLMLKWPNDLLLGGAKLSGILLERAGNAVVIGVGVNLTHHPDLPDRVTTSLAEHGAWITAEHFLNVLADCVAGWLRRWRSEGLAAVLAAWIARAHTIGTALRVGTPDGAVLEGLFDGLDENGALLLRLAGSQRHVIHAADVFLI